MVFKGSLYILNLLCGMLPCEHKYPYPDTSSPAGPQPQPHSVDDEGVVNATITNGVDQIESNLTGNGDNSTTLTRNFNNSSYVDNVDVDPLVVHTTTGKVRGYWMRIVGGERIRAFEGLPYAEPPIDERRFQAPIPVKPWEGVLEANLKGPKCLQYNDIVLSRVVGSENCLFLNIYTKQLNEDTGDLELPVVVYIHGGGFLTGSGNDFGPAYLLQRDLVLVTINYRLGVIGFMSTMDDSSPGNYGLKDVSEAINWVFNSIGKFGGDPEKITLLGHGAGGVSVHLQMMSFLARGKFTAGISISGTAFNQWAMHTKEQALNMTKKFAKALHCPVHGSTGNIVKCLRDIRGVDLAKMQIQFLDEWPLPLSLFRPVIENEYQKETAFLTESPEEAYRKGTVDLIPWICGQAEDEGYSFLLSHIALGTFGKLRSKWNSLASDFLNYNDLPVDQEEITRRVNWLYFRRTNPEVAPLKTYTDALGARLIQTGIHKGLQAHSQFAETYAFMFGYKGKYNLGARAGIKSTEWAVGHGEILGYILNSTDTYPGFKKNDSELILSKILVNLIHNFAQNHVPGFTTATGENFHIWNRITDPMNMSFLHIDKTIKMIPEPYLQQTLFWESFGLPDSLPLANFSSEIQNVSVPMAKGFVSTDVSVTGGSIPEELKPPLELNGTVLHYFSNDVSMMVYPEPQTAHRPPMVPSFIPLPTIAAQLSMRDVVRPKTTELRWLSQDFGPLPIRNPVVTSMTSTSPPPEELRAPPKPTENADDPPPSIFSNFISNLFNPNQNGELPPPGVSEPVITDEERRPKLVTKSNFKRDYMNYLGVGIGRALYNSIGEGSGSSKDETMIMMSNGHDRYYGW